MKSALPLLLTSLCCLVPAAASHPGFDPTTLAPYPKTMAKDAQPARFLLALADLRDESGSPAEVERRRLKAARAFDQLAGKYKLLDSYERLFAARAYLLGGKAEEALDRARAVPPDSVLDCEARFVRGEALRKLDKDKKAAEEYQAYLSGCSGGPHKNEVRARLGEWRSLYLEAPIDSYGAMAEKALEKAGEEARRFSAKELLGRAQVLFDNMRNQESEAAYRKVLEMPGITPEERCTAQFYMAQSVFKQRQRPRAAPLFDEAISVCAAPGASSDDLHMKALYQGARCHGSKGELQAAADLFARAEAAHPGHSYADDARLRQAEMYADLGDLLARSGPQQTCKAKDCPDYEAKLTELLSTLPDRYPQSDQAAEALWRLAFRAYRKKDFKAARVWLDQSLRRFPRETGWDQEGRTLYWLGRLSEIAGDDAAAAASYRREAMTYPLSYYTLLSFNRLRERMPRELDALLAEVTQEPSGEETEWHFPQRALFSQPGFQRGVELLRLGLGHEAKQELIAVGLKVPEGKGTKVTSPEQEDLLWLAAVLYNRAGDYYLSHWIPRHTLTAYQRHYPVGAARKEWLLSYPRGYEELLAEAARKNGQPEGLQFAIVREESAFDPLNESFANAIGLTQMIPPTAKRFSEGLPTTREALRDPAINVAIGARFLGFLWSTMQGHPALTIAGYNAGEAAVFRWLKASGDLDLDAWVEAIPFDETRGYTKRVLSSYLAYNWLGPGGAAPKDRVPVISLKLPSLPQARKASAREEDPHRK